MLTVREAFEKAGYPVPEGYELYWGYRHHGGKSIIAMMNPTAVNAKPLVLEQILPGHGRSLWKESIGVDGIKISNLPAIDAYDALPDVVKKVVPK